MLLLIRTDECGFVVLYNYYKLTCSKADLTRLSPRLNSCGIEWGDPNCVLSVCHQVTSSVGELLSTKGR